MNHLQEFFQRVERNNPFLANRVSDPAGAEVDVAAIHDRPFNDLVRYAEQAKWQRAGIGVVVWGEAGIGKSHLLARLCRWAEEDQRAYYAFLHNIQASPTRLPRYVLKCLMSRLTAGGALPFFETPLYRLIEETVPQPLPLSGELPTPADARAALLRFGERLFDRHPHAGADAYAIAEILFRFYLSAYCGRRGAGPQRSASLAVRWLSGDGLDADEAAKLGLERPADPGGTTALADNQAVDSVFTALAELAWHGGRPLIVCFDQIDNLAREQIEALTQFMHTLIDHARNLLVVTSGVQSKLLDWIGEGAILPAAWERIAQDELRLHRIGIDQARQLLEARLERFFGPPADQPEIEQRRRKDPLFPLGRDWFARRTGGLVEIRPRDAINWARQQWRQQQQLLRAAGGPAWLENWPGDGRQSADPLDGAAEPLADEVSQRIDARISARIEEQIADRQRAPANLPPDADNAAGLVRALLERCIGREDYAVRDVQPAEPARGRRQPAFHLTVWSRCDKGAEVRTAVTCLSISSPIATALALRRMVELSEPPDRMVLVTEQRQPLVLGAKGKEYLQELTSRGPERFEHVELTFLEYAELDALLAAIGDARSGDLEVELPGGQCRPIREEEAVDALHRLDRFRRHRLLGTLLSTPQPIAASQRAGETS